MILSDSCLLNGDAWLRWLKPRKEPWRTSIETVAWGRSIAWVGSGGFVDDIILEDVVIGGGFVAGIGRGGASVAKNTEIHAKLKQRCRVYKIE